MHKFKPHKGLKKRVKVTARGRVKRRKSYAGHLMSGKSGNRRRRLRSAEMIRPEFEKQLRRALGED